MHDAEGLFWVEASYFHEQNTKEAQEVVDFWLSAPALLCV